MRRLLLLAVLGAACTNEKAAPDSTTPSVVEGHGPEALLLRVPRGGGTGRVYRYVKMDSTVFVLDEAPAIDHVLAFDPNAGSIAVVDSKGFPARLDLRETDVVKAAKTKLTSLSSANGNDIYGINAKGEIIRLNPNGSDWKFKPPVPARAVFAQPNGDLIISGNKGAQTLVWRVRPPDETAEDSTVLPLAGRGVRTPLGDRIYFTIDSGLVGVKAKDLSPVGAVQLESRVRALAPTPSGDRLYLATMADSGISIVDRYTGRLQSGVRLPQPPSDLRMDALGRYLLARFPQKDSAWVIAIGTNRLVGAVATRWQNDLPAVTPDGQLALLGTKDVTLVDAEKLGVKSTIAGGAKDFWHFFAWDGFRPRAKGLDQPVTFGSDSAHGDTLATNTAGSSNDQPPTVIPADSGTVPPPASVDPARPTAAGGFIVSFAALLSEEKARQVASGIKVNGVEAHVVSTTTAGSPIFRVVMGPFPTRDEANKVGRVSKREYWIYEGSP
ncbi:MAG TPA: SPOR domain-containing protein [Gemmatimonadaceae bacterium]|nr:SPOR domain-containing protein [Gemmatimonadaceae bacterium]